MENYDDRDDEEQILIFIIIRINNVIFNVFKIYKTHILGYSSACIYVHTKSSVYTPDMSDFAYIIIHHPVRCAVLI